MRLPKPLKIGDIAVVLAVILLAASSGFIFFLDFGKKVCIISQNNVIMEEVNMTKDLHKQITLDGDFKNIVEIDGERVRIVSSDCPNQLCVHSGWISNSGQAVVCLPNHVMVRISSHASKEVDIVAK